MQGRKPIKNCTVGKSLKSNYFIKLCVLAFLIGSTLSSEFFLGLDQDFFNPGIGVNYYGKIQNTTKKTFGNGLTFKNLLDDFVPRDCSKAPKGSNCIQGDRFGFEDPALLYSIFHHIPCNFSNPYRSYNGTCVNTLLPTLGVVNDCYFRFTAPYYEGYGDFRKSASGKPLPEPRDISLTIFKDDRKPEANLSFQFLTFGQLIAHDVSRAVQPLIDCCAPENIEKEECAPISARPDDPFYSHFNQTCINFQRSEQCTFGTFENRVQKNGVTAAIDASFMYGVSENKANELRTLDGTGRLKSTESRKFSILPNGKDPEDPFCPKIEESECFIAGDPRVNQHASLTSMQTALMREHNRLAKELKELNPHWEEEQLFQEARKIAIAELQCITYQDFLPILLSPRIMDDFDITIREDSKGTLFFPLDVIAVWHEFAHAAFRLHSMVPSNIGALNLRFKDTFSNPYLIHQGHTTDLINGSQFVPTEMFDRYMVKDVTDFLYQQPGVPFGLDLAATNIQRGRDHGLGPYVEIIKFCTERTIDITSFEDLIELEIMPPENVQLLKQLYESVLDVDMWVGMQLENHMPGSILGPSAVCICAKQFFFSQKGDRFFFSHRGLSPPFTEDQRSTIKNVSLGRIMCDNTNIRQIAKNPFLLPSADNPLVSCEEIPKVNLSIWKENE